MKKKRGIFLWLLLALVFSYAFIYIVFVWLHRRPDNELLLRSVKRQ